MEAEKTVFTLDDAAGIYYHREYVRRQLEGAKIVFAVYIHASYAGDWLVVYVKDGLWFKDSGSHCSCNEPEFNPVPVKPSELLEGFQLERLKDCVRRQLGAKV